MNDLYLRNIVHRDFNINNIMLNFPELSPTIDELQDPQLFQKLEEKIHKRLESLHDPAFEVKVIDFGLSKVLKHGDFA